MLEKVEEFNMDKVIQEFELLTRDAERERGKMGIHGLFVFFLV